MGFIQKFFNSSNTKGKSIFALEADRMLRRTKELANIANKTTDRDEFYRSINEIKSILMELTKYEGKLPFVGSPSSDLRNLKQIEQKQIELLEKRIEEKNKTAKNESKITPIQEVKPIAHQNISIDGVDEYFIEAGKFIIEKDKASIGIIQRIFKIGFNRAMRIMDQLGEAGVVGPEEGTKPRRVLMSLEEFERLIEENTPNDTQEESGNIEEVPIDTEWFLKDRLNIDTDYLNDGDMLKKFKNIIIPSAQNDLQIEFINKLLKYNSPETMRLILIDDSIINYSTYDGVPQLLIPIVTDGKKIDAVVSWCISEFEYRIRRFVEYGVKNIDSFNEKRVEKGETPCQRIICIINEAKEFFDRTSKPLERLFMNSNMVGIYFILFSRFSLKGLSLGIIGELIEAFTDTDLRLLLQNESANRVQNISRNFDDMEGHQFEYFCADVLRKNGFGKVEVTQGSGDQGIDILAEKDGITYAIQCKCYSSNIGNAAVQQAHTGKSLYRKDIAVVMTNRYFTSQATEEANSLGVKLWDRDKLNEMIGNQN